MSTNEEAYSVCLPQKQNDTSCQNPQSILDALDTILRHINLLDKANNEEALSQHLQGLLESLGLYTRSDRSYLFEWTSEANEAFYMTHEWCAKGVRPTFDLMQNVSVQQLPNWMPHFQKGDAIVSQNWDADAPLFPKEYQVFAGQNIHTMIVLPIFSNKKMNGFIGLDNPDQNTSATSLRLLSSVSGHLGSVKENLRMVAELEEKQEQLSHSLLDLEYEKRLQDTLCIDYTAVYYCDLLEDTMITVKQEPFSNMALLEKQLLETSQKEALQLYSFRMNHYYKHVIIPESAPDFTEKFSSQNLIQLLKHQNHIVYRFRAKPDAVGHEHFELHVVRLIGTDDFKIVAGFRYIDDLIEEQDRQRTTLENALAEANLNNEIINSISKIYWLIYRMDLQTDTYEEISAGQEMHRLTGKHGKITEVFKNVRETIVSKEHQEKMCSFLDISTLPERLKDTDTISTEYYATNGSWHTARFIVKKRSPSGQATSVLYLTHEINKEKQKELEYERQLAQIAEEAQRANVAKTDFLRRMSHDIRTPINGIQGMLSIANHYPDDLKKQQECRDKVMEASGFLLDLVNNVLDMNKMESGNLILECKSFDLLALFQESNSVLEIQSQLKDIPFIVTHSGIVHTHLLGSPVHIKQILQNIIGNAIKYNRPGGSVHFSCTELSCENGKATYQLVCSDNGRGMSKEFQMHAFEPFAQEQNDARTIYMGTGLGLSIAKQLIDMMGGSISLESELNVGTTFTITLSFDIDPDYEDRRKAEAETMDISLAGIQVLLVEDNDLNTEIAKFTLEQAGMIVTTAENGKEALQLFANSKPHQFDVILMDVMMPVMDGLTATKKIRALNRPDAASIPIFAMTANAFLEDIEQSKAAGMNEHLSKPLYEKELLHTIMRYVTLPSGQIPAPKELQTEYS